MATIGTAYVQILPSMEGIGKNIESSLGGEVSSIGASTGSKFSSGFSKAVGVGAMAIGAVTVAVGATVGAMGNAIAKTAQYGDSIDKNSQKLGISSKAYQEWSAVLEHSGTSIDSMGATFRKLATESQNASAQQVDAFEKLGLSMEQVQSMSAEDLFASVVTGLQGMEEGTERTALATTLLGRGASELGALLNTSAEDTQAMIDAVNDLGGVMSEEAVKASAKYQDSLQDLQTTFTGIKTKLTADFLPAMSDVMSGLAKIFSGQSGGTEQIQKGIESIANTAQTMIPKMTDIFKQLLPTIVTAIQTSLPVLMECGKDILMTLVDAILSNISNLIETGLSIILEISTAIAQALPTLIPAIVDVVLTITEVLIDNIDLLVDAGIELIVGLTEGIINALPQLIEKAPVILEKLVTALINNVPKLLRAGLQMQITLASALIQYLPQIISKIPSMIGTIVNGYISYVGELIKVGKEIVEKIKSGIEGAWNAVTGIASGLMEDAKNAFLGVVDNFTSIGSNIVDKIKEGISGAWSQITNFISDQVSKIKINLQAPSVNTNTSSSSSEKVKSTNKKITQYIESEYDSESIDSGNGITQIFNFGREVANPIEMARSARIEAQYGLMKGVAIG